MQVRLAILLALLGVFSTGCTASFPGGEGDEMAALLLSLSVAAGSGGLAVTESSGGTSVSEAGLTDTYTIALNSEPSDTVTVNITFDGTQLTVNESTSAVILTFTGTCPGTSCWNTEQTVTVGGVNNTTIEATNTTQTITHTLASGDSNYAGRTSNISVALLDNALTWSVASNPTTADDLIENVAMDANYIYAVGYDINLTKFRWRMEKRDINTGALVTGFGTGGIISFDPSVQNDAIEAVDVDANYIYLAGYQRGVTDEWRVEKRDINTGALVAAFGTAGVLIVEPAVGGADRIHDIAISATDIYLAGYDSTAGNRQWRIERRDLTTGALVGAFGTGGVVTSNPSINSDEPREMVLDGGNLYIAGFDRSIGAANQWRVEKRNATNGALIGAFGTGGVVLSNPSVANFDNLEAMAVDGTSIYLVGLDRSLSVSDGQTRIEKRNKVTGALDAAFGTAGVILINPSSANDIGEAIAVDAARVYVVVKDGTTGNNGWRVYAYNITTGALDTTFDGDGVLPVEYGTGSHGFERGLLVDNTYLYLAGMGGLTGDGQWRMEKRVKASGGFSF